MRSYGACWGKGKAPKVLRDMVAPLNREGTVIKKGASQGQGCLDTDKVSIEITIFYIFPQVTKGEEYFS